MKKTLLLASITYLCVTAHSQQNTTCANMTTTCISQNTTLSLNSNVGSAEVGNNYGCLGSQPNPSWVYLTVNTSGDISMTLSAPIDIDFIIYGPFNNYADAVNLCGSYQNIVDCSYSATNNETPEIGSGSSSGPTSAIVGEVYVMLVTNYANSTQTATLTQTGGSGATDCNQPPSCVTSPGTFTSFKNGLLATQPIVLCEDDSFSINSNQDYILPLDTIAQPLGDGIYSAQLMWLVYNGQPLVDGSGNLIDPLNDPNFMGYNHILATNNISATNSQNDTLLQNLGGCGTYYFVPVAGDDGIGGNNNVANGVNDNGIVAWDTDGNNCFLLGQPIQVTFSCPFTISANPTSPSCNVCNDGSIDLSVNDPSGTNSPFSFVWSNGELTEDIFNVSNGIYTVDVTSNNGCTKTLAFNLNDNLSCTYNYEIISNVLNSTCSICTDGQINMTLNDTAGYYSPFTFSWSTGETTEDISNLSPGQYDLTITDVFGCDTTVSITVLDASTIGLEKNNIDQINIYPNPVTSFLYFDLNYANPSKNIKCSIYDIDINNEIVFEGNFNNQSNSVDISAYPSGIYYLKLTDSNNTFIKKFIISK